MSMFSTFSTFVQSTLTTATATVESVNKGLDIGNDFITNNHKRITKTCAVDNQLAVAKHHEAVSKELQADENLKKQFEAIAANW